MHGPVVVGGDGSPSAAAAAAAAAHEALVRGAALRVVHAIVRPALNVPAGESPLGPQPYAALSACDPRPKPFTRWPSGLPGSRPACSAGLTAAADGWMTHGQES